MPDFNLIFRPFKRLGDVLKLIILAKIFPRDIPNRYKSIVKVMNEGLADSDGQEQRVTEESMLALSQKLETCLPEIGTELAIPTHINKELQEKGMTCKHLMPHIKFCCGTKCKVILNNKVVVYEKNNIWKGSAYKGVCKKCNAEYLLTTWKPQGGEWTYYEDCSKHDYFQSTRCSVFQKEFLESIDRNIFRKISSFEAMAYCYNDEVIGASWMVKDFDKNSVKPLDRRVLSEAWSKWHMVIWKEEMGLSRLYPSDHEKDMQTILPLLRKHFTKKWSGPNHKNNCANKDCSKSVTLDGHAKGSRLVCSVTNAVEHSSEELGVIETGCPLSPLKGSYYCIEHQNVQISDQKNEPLPKKPRTEKKDDECEEDLQCKTDKSQYAADKHRAAGTCYSIYNCGIIVGITELYGSESLTQVYMFLVWLYETMDSFPKLLAYDDACHLKRFMNKRMDTPIGKLLGSLTVVVDKFHFKNHVDKWCRANVNPYKVPDFQNLNTEVCEETFRHVARYRHITKHMSYGSFHLFHMTLADIYNNDKLVLSKKRNQKSVK